MKIDDITLDYILTLILEKFRENNDIDSLKNEIRRLIKSSLGTRAKEELVISFINEVNLVSLKTPSDVLDSFYKFAKGEKEHKINSLIKEESLKEDSKRFIEKSIKKGYVEYYGNELDSIMPPISRIKGAREKRKQGILGKIRELVEVFIGI